MTVLQKVKKTLVAERLLAKGEAVLVALSGGPDSVALLHLLTRLEKPLKLRLKAVHINHRLRAKASLRDEKFCARLCDDWGVELVVIGEDIRKLAAIQKKGIEETARDFRYTAFEKLAESERFDRIALGHHADDQVETILFRLARGTGPTGLLGMPISRGRIIRLLLKLSRTEIVDYLRRHKLTWCEDASNRDTKFRRNYIRHQLLPQMRKNLNPQIEAAILGLADTLAAEDDYLTTVVSQAACKCLSMTVGGKISLDLNLFDGYALWLRRRLLRRCVKATWPGASAPDKAVIGRLIDLADKGDGAVSLPGQVQARIAGRQLFVYRAVKQRVSQELVIGQSLVLEWPAMKFSSRTGGGRRPKVASRPRAQKVSLDFEQVELPLELRSVRLGDRFRPLGMRGHKKIGNYLTDRKVPAVCRDEILVLCDSQGPIWLVGLEIADRVKVTERTRKVLTVGYSVTNKARRSTV